MLSNGNQMAVMAADKNELRHCTMHLWKSYSGLGLNLKNSKNEAALPHLVKEVDAGSPAQYAGVLANDLILKVGTKSVENEKFDTVLKLIKDQLKKSKKVDLLLANSAIYPDIKRRFEVNGKRVDFNEPVIKSQIKHYESPVLNPNATIGAVAKGLGQFAGKNQTVKNTSNTVNNIISTPVTVITPIVTPTKVVDTPPEPRLCHLLTWSTYDGYGFYAACNNDGCYVKNVEPNSPAQMGGLKAYDRIIEINGKSVYAKDKDYVMKEIANVKAAQTAAKNATIKSNTGKLISKPGTQYLDLLVADPNTFKWLNDRKINISSTNKNLKVQEIFTPHEDSLLHKSKETPVSTPKPPLNDNLRNVILKTCTVRRLRGKEAQPLGFEMTKRGIQAHHISRVDQGSSAAFSGLGLNDYLIELNDKNIENDENSLLRQKIIDSMERNGEIKLLTMNKTGYDYCTENYVPITGFIQLNRQKIQNFETPRDLSTSVKSVVKMPTPVVKSSDVVITNAIINKHPKYAAMPRRCVIRKTPTTEELGLSIARIKNVNEHIINDVIPGSLADKAGVRQNDVLLEVNGENVENKSHAEIVNKIVELARQPSADIALLLVDRNMTKSAPSTPVISRLDHELYSTVKSPSSSNLATGTILSTIGKQQSVNNLSSLKDYPEIKLCEFLGYPKGTQLGLVITSDDYSHDVIKVADGSPAAKAGINVNDVIIAVNGINVEGDTNSIEILNDFSELKPLRILAASRYAYEWAQLLRIRINEKDWPNIRKTVTKYTPAFKPLDIYSKTTSSSAYNINNLIPSIGRSNNNLLTTKNITSSMSTLNKSSAEPFSFTNLSRSAVDITADGRVLRLCTLVLDPASKNANDTEFGFDLITKVGGAMRKGEYLIDTVDDESPASYAGLRPGDQIIEVDGIDVRNKTFEEVVRLINEAKMKSKLRLLVNPYLLKNYGVQDLKGDLSKQQKYGSTYLSQYGLNNSKDSGLNVAMNNATYKSLPDLHYELKLEEMNNSNTNSNKNFDYVKNLSKSRNSRPNFADYDNMYAKKSSNNNLSSFNKSSSNIYATTNSTGSLFELDTLKHASQSLLQPTPRLCTLFKNDSNTSQLTSSNIGFGVHTKQTSTIIPNYLRVSIVNYKSPAYLAGLEAGDFIVEINGRNTLEMSHEEALHFIKNSYEVNKQVRLLVVSEFCYNWLRENGMLDSLSSEDLSVFSYADYLRNNHRFVPRACKVKLFPFSKSFGITLETLVIRPSSALVSANKAAAYQSYAHIVVKVDRDSPAYASSIQKGDRIVEVDGINVEAENERLIADRLHQAYASAKQMSLFVVDPDTDNFFKSKCIKLHSMLPIVQHIKNSTDI